MFCGCKLHLTAPLMCKISNNYPLNIFRVYTYMWTLPDLQGGSLKWALKFLLKHTTCYEKFKISLIWIKYFPVIFYTFFINLPEMKGKSPWLPLEKLITCMSILFVIMLISSQYNSSRNVQHQINHLKAKKQSSDCLNLVLFCLWLISELHSNLTWNRTSYKSC